MRQLQRLSELASLNLFSPQIRLMSTIEPMLGMISIYGLRPIHAYQTSSY